MRKKLTPRVMSTYSNPWISSLRDSDSLSIISVYCIYITVTSEVMRSLSMYPEEMDQHQSEDNPES